MNRGIFPIKITIDFMPYDTFEGTTERRKRKAFVTLPADRRPILHQMVRH